MELNDRSKFFTQTEKFFEKFKTSSLSSRNTTSKLRVQEEAKNTICCFISLRKNSKDFAFVCLLKDAKEMSAEFFFKKTYFQYFVGGRMEEKFELMLVFRG